MLRLMLITNEPDLAVAASHAGVDRLFVDLEQLGKQERQANRNTLISNHAIADVERLRRLCPNTQLLVRTNPSHPTIGVEIEAAIAGGADLLMLPMFHDVSTLELYLDRVDGRVPVVPLVETPGAAATTRDVAGLRGVGEVYVGLNDLHVALRRRFMFDIVADGTLDQIVEPIRAASVPFGFGGVARASEGLIPGEMVLAEHYRVGSTSVILSRTFHRFMSASARAPAIDEFCRAVSELRVHEERLARRSPAEIALDHDLFVDAVRKVSASLPS